MKFRPYTYFLCALAIVVLLISPRLIMSLYETPAETTVYKGIVRLWHVTGWRTGGSSGASFLRKRAAEFESRWPHTIVEVDVMTADEVQQALADGKTPDIISYPYGMFDPAALTLTALPYKNLSVSLPGRVYPYMCGGYCILVNVDIADENGLYLDDDWGIRPDDLLDAAAYGVCFDAEDGCSALPAAALHTYPPDPEPNISTWSRPPLPDAALQLDATASDDGLDMFCGSQTCVMIASHRQLFDVGQRYMQGDAPTFCAYAVGGYTDMVQCIGVCASESAEKQAVCTAFAEYLVSDTAQKKLQALGVLPTSPGLDIYEDDTCLAAMYALLCDDPAVVSPQDADALAALARDAFGGDSRALRQLRSRLRS